MPSLFGKHIQAFRYTYVEYYYLLETELQIGMVGSIVLEPWIVLLEKIIKVQLFISSILILPVCNDDFSALFDFLDVIHKCIELDDIIRKFKISVKQTIKCT